MQNKQTFNYDQTKKMLNTLRKLNESNKIYGKVLKEEEEDINKKDSDSDITVINNVDVKIVSSDEVDLKLVEEDKNKISGLIDNFKSQVSNLVDFEPGLTISQEQIRLDGVITDKDLDFVFIAGEENGLYINADMLKIDSDIIEIITKMDKFNESFSTTMNELIISRKNN